MSHLAFARGRVIRLAADPGHSGIDNLRFAPNRLCHYCAQTRPNRFMLAVTLQTHWIDEPKARVAFRWLVAATLALHVFLAPDRSLDWHAAGQSNFSSALNSVPAPALAPDLRQAIEPEVCRRTVRATPTAQDNAAAALAALAVLLVERKGTIQPDVVSASIESSRPRLFDPRAPPFPIFAA